MRPGDDEGPARDRAELLARAARLLQSNGCPYSSFTVRVQVDGRDEVLTFAWRHPEPLALAAGGGEVEMPARPEAVPEDAAWLSPTAEQVIEALAGAGGSGWMSSDQLASALGQTDSERLKVLLSDLAARRVIDSQAGRGYRLRKAAAA